MGLFLIFLKLDASLREPRQVAKETWDSEFIRPDSTRVSEADAGAGTD